MNIPEEILGKIKKRAANEWPDDYVMQKREVEDQTNAWLDLNDSSSIIESTESEEIEKNVGVAEEIFYLACDELTNGNPGKALVLFEKSANAGFIPGYWRAVELLIKGDPPEVRPNLNRAYEIAKKGKELGVLDNHLQVVECLVEMGQPEKAVAEIKNIYNLGQSGQPGYDDLSSSIFHQILMLQYCDDYNKNPIPLNFNSTPGDILFIESMYEEATMSSDPEEATRWLRKTVNCL